MRRNFKDPNPTYTYKLSLITDSTGIVIYETDSITTMFSYLSSNPIVANSTLRFNTGDNYIITSTLTLNNNTSFTLTIRNIKGFNPSIDGNNTLATLLSTSNGRLVFDGITFKGALVQASDIGQTIVRIFGGANARYITFKNCNFTHGFCAIRGTDNIRDLTIQDCKFYQMQTASIRIGNGLNTFPDLQDVVIERCLFIDDLNGGIIPNGDGVSKYHPLILVKSCQNIRISNCIFKQSQEGSIAIETSDTVIIENIITTECGIAAPANAILQVDSSNLVTVRNCYIYPSTSFTNNDMIINVCSNVRVYYCSLLSNPSTASQGTLSLFRSKTVLEIAGNLIQQGIYYPINNTSGYVGTLSTDYVSEHDNVILNSSEFSPLIQIENLDTGNFSVQLQFQISFPTYQSTYNRGQNSVYGLSTLLDVSGIRDTGDPFLLTKRSIGYKLVQSQIASITTDCSGITRNYPTSPGAFN